MQSIKSKVAFETFQNLAASRGSFVDDQIIGVTDNNQLGAVKHKACAFFRAIGLGKNAVNDNNEVRTALLMALREHFRVTDLNSLPPLVKKALSGGKEEIIGKDFKVGRDGSTVTSGKPLTLRLIRSVVDAAGKSKPNIDKNETDRMRVLGQLKQRIEGPLSLGKVSLGKGRTKDYLEVFNDYLSEGDLAERYKKDAGAVGRKLQELSWKGVTAFHVAYPKLPGVGNLLGGILTNLPYLLAGKSPVMARNTQSLFRQIQEEIDGSNADESVKRKAKSSISKLIDSIMRNCKTMRTRMCEPFGKTGDDWNVNDFLTWEPVSRRR